MTAECQHRWKPNPAFSDVRQVKCCDCEATGRRTTKGGVIVHLIPRKPAPELTVSMDDDNADDYGSGHRWCKKHPGT
jgi:hypothetical protein